MRQARWLAMAPWVVPLVAVLLLAITLPARAASPAAGDAAGRSASSPSAPRDIGEWIQRMQGASCQRSYSGTFVVLASSGAMASSRISHVCDGARQIERVEALSGTPRTIFRRNEEIRTFLPQSKTVRLDTRDASGLFPQWREIRGSALSRFYVARPLGQERVAGYMTDVVWLQPLDTLRFGYRLWSERETGLVVKLQTVGNEGRVLEQVAFSELDLQSPVRADQLERLMDTTAGYQVVASTVVKTTARAEGWVLRQPVAGFMPVSCYRRSVGTANAADGVLQCIYSDGLATVSLFIQPFDPRHPAASSEMTGMGATQMLTQRLAPDVWLTAVGEVPLHTLQLFANQLERLR
jgi:sigma-E factor negative regulatory protein RseB